MLVKKPNEKAHIPMHRRVVCAIDVAKMLHQLPNPEGFVAANWSFRGRGRLDDVYAYTRDASMTILTYIWDHAHHFYNVRSIERGVNEELCGSEIKFCELRRHRKMRSSIYLKPGVSTNAVTCHPRRELSIGSHAKLLRYVDALQSFKRTNRRLNLE